MKKQNMFLFALVEPTSLVKYALWGFLSPVVSALFALSLQPIVDTGLSGDLSAFGRACGAAVLLLVCDLLFYHRMQLCRTRLVNRCTYKLRLEYFQQMLQQKPACFFTQDSCIYLSKLTDDAPLIATDVLGSALDMYRCIWSLVASLAVLATAGWEAILLVLICALISVYLPKCLQHKSDQTQQAYLTSSRNHLGQAQETVSNFLPIRLYQLGARQLQAYTLCAQDMEQKDSIRQQVRLTLNCLVTAISQFGFLAILAGATFLVIQGKLSVGYTMSITQLLGGVMAPFELLPGHWMALRTGKALYESNRTQLQQGLDAPGQYLLSQPPRYICFHQVSFSYPHHPPVLRQLHLQLDYSKKYALVGESGCGKSTLAKLMMGFLSPTHGCITLDDKDIRDIAPQALYAVLGYQGQAPTFFRSTLEDNILLGRTLSPERWQALLQQSQLKEWVDHLPQQAQTPVEENGKNLSGGQAQRVALARCLAGQPNFLVLDEITAALDPHTALQLERTALSLPNVGVLAVTHHINEESMRLYDGILFLKNGIISEQGTWEELMARRGDFYRMAAQFNSSPCS